MNAPIQHSTIVTAQITQMADLLGLGKVDPVELKNTLIATAFNNGDKEISDAQMASLLIVAGQYKLNPWTKEIYAFPDKNKGIIPVVGVDGWSRIVNSSPNFDGLEFKYSENMVTMEGAKVAAPEWVDCIIYRKDRERPTVVREYLAECYRPPFKGKYGEVVGPWQSHPSRFLRHKATIQCARLAFGFVGIYDQDEAERIQDGGTVRTVQGETGDLIPDGYQEFEEAHLNNMRELAFEGMEALETGYAELPKGKCRSHFWTMHKESLKAAAQKADQPQGEVYEHSPAE